MLLFGHTRLSEKEKIGLKCKTWEIAMQYGKYLSGLFEDICFRCGKAPENECDESNKVSVNEGYYYYCDECYATTSGKKKRTKNTKNTKIQSAKKRK